ncbi:MAG: PKD domain-containing protein, partial [Opitutaceae bacterium]
AAAITTISASGTYRIARHDDAASAGVRALRLAPAGMNYEYWVEHRRVAPTAFNAAQQDRLKNGVLIRWGAEKSPSFTSGQGSYLLDATPGSAGGANDAPLKIGETFVDPDAGISFKPLAIGGTAPNEYIDVQVGFGAVDGNRNPVIAADRPAGALTARSNVVFNATASDPDGDPLYFRWDFGDGQLQPSLPSLTRRFLKGGDYTLRVSAHDGRGGIDVRTLPLRVEDPLVSWNRRAEPVAQSAAQLLYDVTHARGLFVAVGLNQTVLTSPDGASWTRRSFPAGNSLTGVTHDGTRFVASGYRFSNPAQKGLAAHSPDGITWTTVPVDTGLSQFWGIAAGAGRIVMVGDNGSIWTSADGNAWSAASSGVTGTLRSVAFADGLFVASGDSGRLLTSPDGRTWTNRSLASANSFTGVAKHAGQWVARSGSTVFSSPDGTTWSRVTTTGASNTSTYRMLSVGGVLLSSHTGATVQFAETPGAWESFQLENTSNVVRAFAANAATLVAVGNNGFIYSTAVPVTGSALIAPPSLRLDADSIKVAVGRRNVLAATGSGFARLELYVNGSKVSEVSGSSGALPWTPASVGNYLLTVRGVDAAGVGVVSAPYPAFAAFANWRWLNPDPAGADLRGAVRVGEQWWIVGGGGTLLTLDDGGTFTSVDFPTTQSLNAIAYANGRFVIATTDLDGGTKEDIGGLWTSGDGYAWTPFLTGALDSANLNTAIFAADRWIALGTGGTIVTSTDGVNWPRTASGITTSINGVASGGGLIVAVASGGKIVTSSDGLTWTERTSGITTDLRAVTHAGGSFVAVGLGGVILTSSNGTTWNRATSG